MKLTKNPEKSIISYNVITLYRRILMSFQNHSIDKSTPIPMYFQLKNIVLDEIKSGNIKSGDILPTEIEFGEMFGLSRTTIRQAILELVTQGYLYRIKGKGTFVGKPKLMQDFMRKIESYDEQMKRLNMTPSTKVLKNQSVKASLEVSKALNIQEDDDVILLRRLRFADDVPVVILDTYLTFDCNDVLTKDMEQTGLYEYLSKKPSSGIRRVVRQFEAVGASADESKYLQIDEGHPIQLVTTTGYNATGKVIEYSIAKYRGDKNKFIVELESE